MIFLTRPAASSAARPVSPLPALLLTIVSSRAPCSSSAPTSSFGRPAVPKPPTITVAPSGTSATAAARLATSFWIMVLSSPGSRADADGGRMMARAGRPSHSLRIAFEGRRHRRGFIASPEPDMAFPVPTPRFPLLGKIVAIVLVLLALTLALQTVSGIVAEREGRLREAEASVAASLAASQTVLGPILQRDCTESWDAVQGEGKDRKVVTERRSWKLAAAPASLDVAAQVALEPRYRGIFKVNGYVMKATLAADLARRQRAVAEGRARRLAPELRAAAGAARARRCARRAQRHGPGRRQRGRGAAGHRSPGARPRLPRRRERCLCRRIQAALGAAGDRAGRYRRPGLRAGRRVDPGGVGLGLAASVVRRSLPAARADGRRHRLSRHLEAEFAGDDGASGGRRRRRGLRLRQRPGRRAARARAPGAAWRPSASPSSTR